MEENEYNDYLRKEILDRVGLDFYNKIRGMVYPPTVYHHGGYDYRPGSKVRHYVVEENRTRNYVRIETSNYKISYAACDCHEYYRNRRCLHIAAALMKDARNIIDRPPTKYEISKKILDKFSSAPSTDKPKLKEKINMEVEIDLDTNKFRLYFGLSKLYVLNTERKLVDFSNAYEKHTYEFGAKFTYDPSLHFLSKEDEEIFNILKAEYYTDSLSLSEKEMKLLLEKLKTREFKLSNYGKIKHIEYNLPSVMKIEKQGDDFKLKLDFINDFTPFGIDEINYLAKEGTLYILTPTEKLLVSEHINNRMEEIVFKEENLDLFKNGLLKRIKNSVVVDENVTEIVVSSKPEIKLYIDFDKDKIKANIKLDYKGKVIDYLDKDDTLVRDDETENEAVASLLKYGFEQTKKCFEITELDQIGDFFENGLEELSNQYEVFTTKNFKAVNFLKEQRIKSMFSINKEGILSYSFNADNINTNELSKIFASIRSKKRYYKLKNGDLLKLDGNEELNELNNVFTDLQIDTKNLENGEVEIPKYRAFYIDSLKDNKYKNITTDNSFEEFINKFKEYKNIEIDFDDFDKETLREYQKDGVKWLYTLYKCYLGGILADEMGLGKSIQTISFIKQVLKEKPEAKIMIVSPTSLVYNWKKEFDKFGSELKYTTVAENKQKRLEIINNFDNYNIFITSYGLIRNDNDEYENKEFEVCIIDEAQAIKNHAAGMTKEIKKIKARTKMALTGTPLENSIYELWSIFDFIMPGYLNNLTSFREIYGIKDIDEASLEKLDRLNYQIKPFILRRKKKDVSKDLPDKIENDIYLELPEYQKAFYVNVVKEAEEEINDIVEKEGWAKASFKLLSLLTRLREVCIDPSVAYDDYKGEAIKIEKLTEIVKDLSKDGHKILVFSMFKSILDNVKTKFDKEGITSYSISGEVKGKTRTELVDKFNDDDTNCFLITTKSGGTGLNLTGADIVIHLDIWWNPQVENQATDRAHRIGQTKTVTVIRLITKGTIEEKIVELQSKKKVLADSLIENKNSSSTISNLTEEEMRELLSFGQD